ncbi:MAG: hypothetical protein JWN32_2813 [Solirubrobacterales bacterium]|nr:hypothetical protein [Solirubrobacterales bacterium]
MTDAERTARLAGADRGEIVVRPVPAAWHRAAQRAAMKAGLLTYERTLLPPVARRVPSGAPRLLIRVDEFPDYSAYDEYERHGLAASTRFHDVMAEAGVPHLIAVVPQLTHRALDPGADGGRPLNGDERALLERMAGDGVEFAQHGTTHRTRHADPRRRSELVGLSPAEAAAVVDAGRATLRELGIVPRVFVPPFNRFDPEHYSVLAERFAVVCGGPESVPRIGLHYGPQWRDGAVYLPCYPPFYGRARDIVGAVKRLVDAGIGTWVPIVLHMSWEAEDEFAALRRFAQTVAPYATPWADFLAAVDRTGAAA